MLDSSFQIIGYLLITEGDIAMELRRLNKNTSAGPSDIHSAIIKPLAGIIASRMCMLFQTSIEQVKCLKIRAARQLQPYMRVPELLSKISGQSASPIFYTR